MNIIVRNIPNSITCLNLLAGCMGISILIFEGMFEFGPFSMIAGLCVFLSAFFDFFDGLAARALKVASPIGRDLDSLADVVSFGVLPALLIMKVFIALVLAREVTSVPRYCAGLFLIIPVLSAVRLARFNNDTSQSYSFKGLPTPANGLILASIAIYFARLSGKDGFSVDAAFFHIYSHPVFLIGLPLLMGFLLLSNIPLMAFKVHNFSAKRYLYHFLFLGSAILIGILLGFASGPIILLLYFIFSFIHFRFNNHEIQSGN